MNVTNHSIKTNASSTPVQSPAGVSATNGHSQGVDFEKLIEAVRGSLAARVLYEHRLACQRLTASAKKLPLN